MNLHFISGLPRSGSTLLAAILRQNPRFHAGMSTPLSGVVMKMQQALSRGNEGAQSISDEQKRDILAGVFHNFYAKTAKPVIFDTSRAWCSKLPLIASLLPDAKIVCCVRDVSWIVDSIERIQSRNPLDLSGIFGFNAGGTVFSRVTALASSDGLVGYALNALKEAYFGERAAKLLLVEYEALARQPSAVMKHIYGHIGEPEFEHDFVNVNYEADDFDLALGTPSLHKVTGPVVWRDRDTILPPSLFERFASDAFWRDQKRNVRKVPVVMYAHG